MFGGWFFEAVAGRTWCQTGQTVPGRFETRDKEIDSPSFKFYALLRYSGMLKMIDNLFVFVYS
jgi:hypothetical protein